MREDSNLPCHQKEYLVNFTDSLIVCPPLNERIWDAHPRIYLTLKEEGYVDCPYCGTKFVLKNQ